MTHYNKSYSVNKGPYDLYFVFVRFFFPVGVLMATDPKRMFTNLKAGDVIATPGMTSQFLVLKTQGEGGTWKHFGQICGCGNHVRGIPRLFQWSDERDAPVDKAGNVLDIWHGALVDKDVSGALAKKFEGLAVDDDSPSDAEVMLIFKNNPNFLKAVEIGHYSNAEIGVTIVAMIRALGGTLSDEQASLVAATMRAYGKVSLSSHLSTLSELFGTLSGVKH